VGGKIPRRYVSTACKRWSRPIGYHLLSYCSDCYNAVSAADADDGDKNKTVLSGIFRLTEAENLSLNITDGLFICDIRKTDTVCWSRFMVMRD